MKKREISNIDLDRMFNNMIEQAPIISEEQVSSFLITIPELGKVSAAKRFFQHNLNNILVGTTVLLIISAALFWVNPNPKNEWSIVQDKEKREIVPVLPDTLIAKPLEPIVEELNHLKIIEDTVIKVHAEKVSSAIINEVSAISFDAVNKHFNKKPQVFNIQSNKDAAIVCKEGTSINIRANSFVSEKTGRKIVGDIQLEVKEYYKASDIILDNLTTTSGNRILETGGMLHISVSADDETCIIKPECEIDIGFPYSKKKEDMELFYGEWKDDKIDWESANNSSDETVIDVAPVIAIQQSEEIVKEVFYIVEDMPEFPGGSNALKKYMEQNTQYPYSVLKDSIEGKVFITFVINKNGNIDDVRTARGLNNKLDKAAAYIVSNLPKWKPGKQRGKPVNVSYTIPVYFSLKNGGLTDEEIAQSKLLDENLKGFKYERERFEEKVEGDNFQTSNVSEVNRYMFGASRLGWLNCDRFYNADYLRTNISISIDEPAEAKANLIFHKFKTVIGGLAENDKLSFNNIPVGERVTIVALKKVENQIMLAIKETQITGNIQFDLDFQPVTLDLLRKEMEKLNKIGF